MTLEQQRAIDRHQAVCEFLEALPSPYKLHTFQKYLHGTAQETQGDDIIEALSSITEHLHQLRNDIYYSAVNPTLHIPPTDQPTDKKGE